MKREVIVATFRLPAMAFRDPGEFGRVLAARAFAAAREGAELAVFPGRVAMGLVHGLRGRDGRLPGAEEVRELFLAAGARLARATGMYVVPGSIDVPVGVGYRVHYTAVIAPDGSVVGEAYQTHPGEGEDDLSCADEVACIDLPWGRVGVLLGEDPWYPEVARILALLGADILVAPLAPRAPYPVEVALAGLWQAAQQNGVYGLEAGLFGELPDGTQAAGRAAIVAPCAATPDGSGFLPRAGYFVGEGALVERLQPGGLSPAAGGANPQLARALGSLYGPGGRP